MRSLLLTLFALFSASLGAFGHSGLNDSLEKNGSTTDSVGVNEKKTILLDFDTLTYDNIRVEKAFKMPRRETAFQGMAVFGDYMFQCHHSNNFIDVYDLRDITFAFSIEQKGVQEVHCNNADFGTEYYDKNDPFPLLYLEHRGNKHKTSVYRILKTDTAYTAQRVQTFNFTPCIWSISNNDYVNGHLYVTHGMGKGKGNILTQIPIPPVGAGDITIDLESSEVLTSFDVTTPKVSQDGTIHNNKLFQLKGYSGEGEIKIVDLKKQRTLFIAQFDQIGMQGEPEGIAWYNDHLVVSTVGGQVYNVYFVE